MKSKVMMSLCLLGGIMLSTFSSPMVASADRGVGSISGTITYNGIHDTNHEVLVSVHPSMEEEPVKSVHIQGPGAYSIDDLPDGVYYVSAFLDIHDKHEGPPNSGEPLGSYPSPVIVSGNSLNGIDIVMEDVESDFIQGTACYLGGLFNPAGRLEVGLTTVIDQEPLAHQFISLPCEEYVFSNIPPGSYYVYLFYDLNSSGNAPEPGEPFAYYDANRDGTPNPVEYNSGGTTTGIDITLGGVHRVDYSAMGEGDGTSWEDAFTDLHVALSIAEPGEEIWVASGIYTPGANRETTFELPGGVAIYGGFSGSEQYRYQRNWAANTTVLSGEIGDPQLKTDNVYHVVSAISTLSEPIDESTILDGFTITRGHASLEADRKDTGGGVFSREGNPTLVNLNFIDNYALNHGGAVASIENTQPMTIVNSTFSGNTSSYNAGGIANLEGNILVVNSTLVGNAGGNGGGIVTMGKFGDPTAVTTEIQNSILWGNPGGQITYVNHEATIVVSNSLVEGGYAGGTAIITDNPKFIDADGADNVYGTWDDDLHLQATSPAVDAGDPTELPADLADSDGDGNTLEPIPLDFDGGVRLVSIIDIGADEFDASQAIAGLQVAAGQPMLSGQAISFAARADAGTLITYTWDFGDGNMESGPVPNHTYIVPGVYLVLLRAENNLGFQESTMEVTVAQSLAINPGTSQTTDDGILNIEIPDTSGAVTIIYTPLSEPSMPSGGFSFAGISFQLDAFDTESNPIIIPGEPLNLTLHYDESTLPAGVAEEDLQLFRYRNDISDWEALTVLSRDLDNDELTVQLDHFSDFALFAPKSTINYFLPLIMR